MDGLISTAAQKIVDQGLLGIFLIAITYAYWLRDKAYIASLAERRQDMKDLTAVLNEALSVIRADTAAKEHAAQASQKFAEIIRDIPAIVRAALAERAQRP